MAVNDKYRVIIESLDHNGKGVARVNNIPIFIENALPNEEVEIKIIISKKKFAEGIVVSYITKSKERIESSCPYYKECGGCDLLHIEYENQLAFKENKVKEIAQKFAGLPSTIIKPILFSENVTFYRNKATFKVTDKLGFYKKKTNSLIPIESCVNINPRINETLENVRDYLNLENITEIMIRVSIFKDETMLVINKVGPIDEKSIIYTLGSLINTIIVHEYDRYYILTGNGYITEKIGKYKFKISPESFFQINTTCTNILYEKVLEYCELEGDETVLDLFCGTGTIGIYVSQYAKEVQGIESNRFAVLDAMANRTNNKIKNISFSCKKAENVNDSDKADVVIVDPPRAGLDPKTISFLLKTKPNKIVYVSCDPVTLARDLKLLDLTYKVNEITPVDMFPGTCHVECVAKLFQKNS